MYTLLNAVNLESSLSKKGSAKVYLFFFGNVSGFHTNIFNKVKDSLFYRVYIEKHPNKSNKLVNLFKLVFKVGKTNKIYITKKDSVEIFSQNLIFTLLAPFKLTKAFQYHYIEEGLSSYTDFNHRLENRNFWIKTINYLIYNGNLIPKFKYLYIYNRNLYNGIMETKTLPRFDVSLFKYSTNHEIKNENFPKRMFLGSPLESIDSLLSKKLQTNEKNNFQLFVSEKLGEVYYLLNNKNFYYKAHPNEILNGIHDRFELYHTNFPWELNINSLEDSSILISVFSTAAITPKILYNKEPRLIFLFRLLHPYLFFQAEEFLKRVKNSYHNKDRVVAPRTINELSEILYKFTQ